ncbi:MAG TPA: aldolase/citrate lyase family protein [Myxococcales bacterium]|jgi:citrate lyase subunit beta/citryl-CoA lyase
MAEAGRRGKDVRSDCWVSIEPGGSGLRIEITSKVDVMYGAAIRAQVEQDLKTLDVKDAAVKVEDFGALPFTLSARIEAAARRAKITIPRPLLAEPMGNPMPKSARDRLRRSRLYLPGNEPKFMVNAGLHGPDGVILDLEDSVAPAEKDAARVLVRNALLAIDFGASERQVRINQIPAGPSAGLGAGLDDLDFVVKYGAQLVLIPKVETADQIRAVQARIDEIAPTQPVYLMPIIESALGCFNALAIATASPFVVALTIGLEDYTADIGAQRTLEGKESVWARSVVLNAARAAGVQAIDTVFSDVGDMEGLKNAVLEAKGLGFEGKGCIHPRQIPVVHEAFAPDAAQIDKAKKIVLAFEDAQKRGLGVVSLGSKMIDPPVVKRALATVRTAVSMGKLDANWRDAKPAEVKAP